MWRKHSGPDCINIPHHDYDFFEKKLEFDLDYFGESYLVMALFDKKLKAVFGYSTEFNTLPPNKLLEKTNIVLETMTLKDVRDYNDAYQKNNKGKEDEK